VTATSVILAHADPVMAIVVDDADTPKKPKSQILGADSV
jgi:hypothetical protein